jgi:hypothetical protein
VVHREEEEEVKKKMISLWKKQGKAGEGEGVRASTLTLYSITASTCHLIAHWLRFNYAGRRRGGAMMSGPLVNGSSKTAAPFQFPFIVLLHGRGAIFNLQPSSPSSTSILVTNFIPL